MTVSETLPIGIVVEWHRLDNPWQSERWQVVAIALDPMPLPPWTVLASDAGWTRYFAGTLDLTLYSRETDNYLHNLGGSPPLVFVILRPTAEPPGRNLLSATVDTGEAEAHSDAGDDQIEAVPMPPSIALWMERFVHRHHVEQPFHKRRRDRADPEAMARRTPRPETGHG